jgi:twitching motility protein PilT
MTDTRLGQILLDNGFLKKEDLERCLEIQAFSPQTRPIGEILVDEGVLTRKALQQLIKIQERRRARTSGEPPRPIAMLVETDPPEQQAAGLLEAARKLGVSELFLAEGRLPRARIGRDVEPVSDKAITPEQMWGLLRVFLGDEALERIMSERDLVSCGRLRDIRFRAALFREVSGLALNLRLLPERTLTFAELGLPSAVQDLLKQTRGLILVAGPVGAGKTTTLTSMLTQINDTRRARILVMEEAAEIQVPSKECMISYRQVGRHTRSLSAALDATLRADIDILVIDHLLDHAAADIALRRAQAGRLVLLTLPALDSLRAMLRIIECFPFQEQGAARGRLSSVLRGVVTQRLVPLANGNGRVAACEVFTPNPAALNLVREGKFAQIPLLMQILKEMGCITMDDSLLRLQQDGRISHDELVSQASDKNRMLKTLGAEVHA